MFQITLPVARFQWLSFKALQVGAQGIANQGGTISLGLARGAVRGFQ